MVDYVSKIFGNLNIKVQSKKLITNGQINLVYIVNNEYVLRLPRKGKSPDYLIEKKIHNLLSFMPIPEIIKVDTSENIVPFPYMIQTLIPGELWLESPHLETTEGLYFEAGELLKELHNKKFDVLADFDLRPKKNWTPLFNKMLKKEKESIPSNLKSEIKLKTKEDNSKNVYCLDDFNEGNIMIKNKQISGIIDLEQLRITPVNFSLVQVLERMFSFSLPIETTPKLKHQKLADTFLKGYGKKINFPVDLIRKYLYYNYIFMYNRVNGKNKRIYEKKIKQLMKELS